MATQNISVIEHAAAWKSADLPSKDELAVQLEPRHLDAFDAALKNVERLGVGLDDIGPDCFALTAIADDVAAWRAELQNGRGLVLLRGFPVDRYDDAQWEKVWLGLGRYLGVPVSQSNLGDLVGHVIDVGGKDRRERAYRNNRELSLHTDRCDYIGMLCLQKARSGGVSGYASALAIHNEILANRPELLEPLYAGYRLHRFGEQPAGEPVVTRHPIPVFSVAGAHPNVIYIRGYIDLAIEEGHYALEPLEQQALDYFDELATSDDFCINWLLEPGEAMLTNNCLLLHRRTAFEDDEKPRLKRHLLRLWLVDPDRPMTAAVRRHKTFKGIEKRTDGGTYYHGPGFRSEDRDQGY